jgi:DNA-binding MarR family transcriptional regulator
MNDTPDYGSTENHVGFQIHLTWRAIRKLLLESERGNEPKVSRGIWSVPILISLNPGITPQELARALHLDASKVALLLRSLEADDLVRRSPLPTDRRKVVLTLTETGEQFARDALRRTEAMEQPVTGAITDEERAELVRILTKIRRAAPAGQDVA